MGCKWMSIRVRFPLSMVMNSNCSSVVQVYRNPTILWDVYCNNYIVMNILDEEFKDLVEAQHHPPK
jgi:hypothetical protein